MFTISYYIPATEHDRVKQALFDKGAGKIGQYDECCWEVLGTGQFRPCQGSTPTIGEVGRLHCIEEYKVEMVCADALIREVLLTLLEQHPYEQPAYFVNKVLTLKDLA